MYLKYLTFKATTVCQGPMQEPDESLVCLYLFVCFVGLGTILATLRNFNGQITYLFYPLYLLVKKPCKMNLKTNFWTLSMAPPPPITISGCILKLV